MFCILKYLNEDTQDGYVLNVTLMHHCEEIIIGYK